MLCILGSVACASVTEPAASCYDQVCFILCNGRCIVTVHPFHAQIPRMVGRNSGNAHHGAANRCIHLICQCNNFFASVVGNCTAADIEIRSFCSGNQFCCLLQEFWVYFRNRCFFHNRFYIVFIQSCLNILRNVYEDRSRTTGFCNAERFPNGWSEVFNLLNKGVVLGNRHGNIHFLEAIPSNQRVRNIASDGNQRNGVQISRCDTSDQIGCTWAGSCDDNANFSGCSGVAVCCVGSTLFMCGNNMMNAIACKVQSIIDVDDLTARITENGCRTLFNQCFNDNLCTV